MKRSQSIITTVKDSEVSGLKKPSKRGLSKEDEWYENQNKFVSEAMEGLRTSEMANIRVGDITEELKIEIQQLIFEAKQRSHVN